jgi:hypothetical protein
MPKHSKYPQDVTTTRRNLLRTKFDTQVHNQSIKHAKATAAPRVFLKLTLGQAPLLLWFLVGGMVYKFARRFWASSSWSRVKFFMISTDLAKG